jgi:hypothetical protein
MPIWRFLSIFRLLRFWRNLMQNSNALVLR